MIQSDSFIKIIAIDFVGQLLSQNQVSQKSNQCDPPPPPPPLNDVKST